MSKQVCLKSDTKAVRMSRFKLVIGMTLDTAKAGEAETRSLRDKKDTCLDVSEIMKTIGKSRCSGYRVGSHDWNKPFNDDRFKEEKMFKSCLPSDDDVEVTTPLFEEYYTRDVFIEPITAERLAIASEKETNRFSNAISKSRNNNPFWFSCLMKDRLKSLFDK